MANETLARWMPDIARQQLPEAGQLGWVGMSNIELPVRIADSDGVSQVPARVDAFVDLTDSEARGIHMSRLYLHLDQRLGAGGELSPSTLRDTLQDFLSSHRGLSGNAKLSVRFEWLTRRPALVSDKSGWRSYPFEIVATAIDGQTRIEVSTTIRYSSTCPCSAALARQLIQEKFAADFPEMPTRETLLRWLGSEAGMIATPHSQRSSLDARILLNGDRLPLATLVDTLEKALATPVQTAVKREDEQAFARLNGSNLMFCEDAARRAQKALNALPFADDFWLRASHHESLHPHDAVAVAVKGIPGGWRA